MKSNSIPFSEWCRSNNPAILEEWDYENNDTSPDKVATFSNISRNWICKEGHTWKASTATRAKGHNCPYCAGYKAIPGETDLCTLDKKLAEEWDYEKNKPLLPTEVTPGSGRKVWWRCKTCSYSWEAVISSRKTRGCPRCNNKVVFPGFNDLASQRPLLVEEWSPKNDKTPDQVFVNSNKKAIWVCRVCKNEWEAIISSRSAGNGCPICSNKKIIPGLNDFASTYPKIAEEWSPKNEQGPNNFAPHSNTKVKWLCKLCGHEWSATISDRVVGKGCPECAKEYKISTGEKAVAYYLSKVFNNVKQNYVDLAIGKYNFDVYIPSISTVVEYDGTIYHKDLERDLAKNDACVKNNIEIIRIREKGLPEIPNCVTFEVDYSKLSTLEKAIKDLIEYLETEHNFKADLTIDLTKDYPYILALKYTYIKENSVGSDPILLSQWSKENEPLSPYKVSLHSNIPALWNCPICKQTWSASPNTRSKGHGCGVCNGKQTRSGFNDATLRANETLISEWSPENKKPFNEYTPGSHYLATWICSKCHLDWKAEIKSRVVEGTGCPYCAHKKAYPGVNDLKTKCPQLLEEWDYDKNKNYDPSTINYRSSKKVWWKCKKGHEWQAEVARRVDGSGCHKCYLESLKKKQ